MQALQIGVDLLECAVDVFHLVFLGAHIWHELVPAGAELLAWTYVFVDEILHHDVDEATVLVVCDSSALVDLRDQDLQHLVGNILKLVNLDLELPLAGGKLFGHESLGDVPADCAESLAVARYRVEHRYREQKTLELFGVP